MLKISLLRTYTTNLGSIMKRHWGRLVHNSKYLLSNLPTKHVPPPPIQSLLGITQIFHLIMLMSQMLFIVIFLILFTFGFEYIHYMYLLNFIYDNLHVYASKEFNTLFRLYCCANMVYLTMLNNVSG